MDAEGAKGSTTVTLADSIRASWNRRTKFALGILSIAIAAIAIHDTPMPVTLAETIVAGLTVVSMMLLFACGWLLMILVIVVIYFWRLSPDQRSVAYEFNDAGIVTRDNTGSALTVSWGIVRSAKEGKRAFRFDLKPAGHRYIPKRAFNASQMPMIRAIASEKLSTKAKLSKA